jgi:GT2 family glycosyltransferase
MKEIDLSIIIVNYNTSNLVYDCLKSIKKHLNLNYEVIIVENNPKLDDRIQDTDINKIMPVNCRLLTAGQNNGFGSANNLGAKKASGKYLLLLNPDTLIIDDSIQKMCEFISQHNEIGALTCLLYNDIECKKMQKYFFGRFQSLAGLTIRRYNYKKIDHSEVFFYTDIVTGAALMIKKETFDQIGGFDEKIFMYLEDDDLCKRVVELGYKNAVLNSAKIVHLESQSTNNKTRKKHYYESQDYYWHKHNGSIATFVMKAIRWPIKMLKTNK